MSLHGRKNSPVGSSISSSAEAPVIRGDAARAASDDADYWAAGRTPKSLVDSLRFRVAR